MEKFYYTYSVTTHLSNLKPHVTLVLKDMTLYYQGEDVISNYSSGLISHHTMWKESLSALLTYITMAV